MMQRIVAGIDIGSGRTKIVLVDEKENVLSRCETKTLANFGLVAQQILTEALNACGMDQKDVAYVATTGLGRYSVPFRDIQITEITCAARGARYLFPDAMSVLDMGAQSTRAVKLRENGKVKAFRSNDRCAAGSELKLKVLCGSVVQFPLSKTRNARTKTVEEALNKEITPDTIMKLGLGFWDSKTFLSAIEMGLFTELAKGPATHETLRERLDLHPRGSRDFLDALVALGMLQRNGAEYSNTPETDFFLDRTKPSYIGGVLEMCNARLYAFWNNLTEGLRTGEPQNEAKAGGNLFDILYSDPVKLRQFLGAMTGLSLGIGKVIAQKFPWKEYRSFVDVGGAQGGVPVQIALAHKHLTGCNFDLPVVGPVFEEYVASFGLSDRLKFCPGDFFNDPVPSADVIIMGHILHDWNMDEKQMLVNKAYQALPTGGAFIVFEALIDDDRRTNAFGLLMSLNMLIETRGGFDYTGADCCSWMKAAGFRQTRVEHLAGPDSMVVGIK